MSDGITLSFEALAAFIALAVGVGPACFGLGRLWQRVNTHEDALTKLARSIEDFGASFRDLLEAAREELREEIRENSAKNCPMYVTEHRRTEKPDR